MASVHDVAAYVLEKSGTVTAVKLQKLVYYCQAWHLVWDERPLFKAKIEAWASGPVVRALYASHRQQYNVSEIPSGDASKLTDSEKTTVDAVMGYYGDKTSQQLSDLTHLEAPWRDARKGLAPGEHGEEEITTTAMMEYYSSLLSA